MARSADLLHLEKARARRAQPEATAGSWDWHWPVQPGLRLPGGALTLRADRRGPLDLDALGPVLSVRMRRGGERLRPVRGGPRRSLKGLLQEARVPHEERARLPLLFCRDRLLAVGDRWLDRRIRAGGRRDAPSRPAQLPRALGCWGKFFAPPPPIDVLICRPVVAFAKSWPRHHATGTPRAYI